MHPKSLKNALLLTVAILVIASGVIISQAVTHRYNISLLDSAAAHAENIAHNLALDATDKILVNDLVALQKMLDDQLASDPTVSYLFIIRNHQILTHTMDDGIPLGLVDANYADGPDAGRMEKIISDKGDRYIDIAWPIFGGKAGTLRLGISEEPYLRMVRQLWLQVSLITLGILLVGLLASHLIITRLTNPLRKLAKAAEDIDEGNLETRVDGSMGRSEVMKLAAAFNSMLDRIKRYTRRLEATNLKLEEKNFELDRAHHQLHTSFLITQEISALANLKEVCAYLIRSFKGFVECQNMMMIVFSQNQKMLFAYTEIIDQIHGSPIYHEAFNVFHDMGTMSFLGRDAFQLLPLPEHLQTANQLAVFPFFHHKQLLGGMLIGCPGNCNCVTKELDVLEIVLHQTSGAIRRSLRQEEEIQHLRERIEPSTGFCGLVGKDPKMQVIYKLIEDVASADTTILIQGESGTGKELVARAIHNQSNRGNKPFIVINCSAFPATLLESELFGHEKGSFTGAVRGKAGRFEQANGGTVFLDEIGEISPSAQIKLLRILQNKTFERLGGERTLKVDARILAATNKNLMEAVKRGQFREDLFYRLNVIPIDLPPLRERRNDIPLLARCFISRFSEEQGKTIERPRSEAMRILLNYHWPGNVRELENSIEHAVVLAKDRLIDVTDLPAAVVVNEHDTGRTAAATPAVPKSTLLANEERLMRETLESCNWNKTETAVRLGISRSTLYEKLKKFQITKPTIH